MFSIVKQNVCNILKRSNQQDNPKVLNNSHMHLIQLWVTNRKMSPKDNQKHV